MVLRQVLIGEKRLFLSVLALSSRFDGLGALVW